MDFAHPRDDSAILIFTVWSMEQHQHALGNSQMQCWATPHTCSLRLCIVTGLWIPMHSVNREKYSPTTLLRRGFFNSKRIEKEELGMTKLVIYDKNYEQPAV